MRRYNDPAGINSGADPAADVSVAADVCALERVRTGDTASLIELYDRHGRTLYGLILQIAGDGAPAAQMLEDVLVRIWTGADIYDPALGTPRAWLIGLARHRALDHRRESRHDRAPEVMAANHAPDHSFPAPVLARETQGRIAAALESLPAPHRDLVAASFFGGFSVAELAARFNLSEGDVRSGLRLGMLGLSERLAGLGWESGDAS